MKLVQVLAIANATLAVASALLSTAPFTPAIFLFVIYAPLACIFAVVNQAAAALVVVAATALAWLLSPIRYESPFPLQLFWPIAWVVSCSVLATLLSFSKVRAAILALFTAGASGA